MIVQRLPLVIIRMKSVKKCSTKGKKNTLNEKCHQREEKSPTRSVNSAQPHVASSSSCRVGELPPAVIDDCSEVVFPSNKSRKRKRYPHKWKKNILKEKRHNAEGKSPLVNCAHATKPSNRACHVSHLAQADLDLFFRKLYSMTEKEKQDTFLLKCMTVVQPKRKRLIYHRFPFWLD